MLYGMLMDKRGVSTGEGGGSCGAGKDAAGQGDGSFQGDRPWYATPYQTQSICMQVLLNLMMYLHSPHISEKHPRDMRYLLQVRDVSGQDVIAFLPFLIHLS